MGLLDDLGQLYYQQYTGRGMPQEEKYGTEIGGLVGQLIGSIFGPIGRIAGRGGGRHLGGNIGRLAAGEDVGATLVDQFLTGPIIGRAAPFRMFG